MSKPIDHKDVIIRLCELQSLVSNHIGWHYAADCFCGRGGYWKGSDPFNGASVEGYNNDLKSLEFIEQAVKEKIEREVSKSHMAELENRIIELEVSQLYWANYYKNPVMLDDHYDNNRITKIQVEAIKEMANSEPDRTEWLYGDIIDYANRIEAKQNG